MSAMVSRPSHRSPAVVRIPRGTHFYSDLVRIYSGNPTIYSRIGSVSIPISSGEVSRFYSAESKYNRSRIEIEVSNLLRFRHSESTSIPNPGIQKYGIEVESKQKFIFRFYLDSRLLDSGIRNRCGF